MHISTDLSASPFNLSYSIDNRSYSGTRFIDTLSSNKIHQYIRKNFSGRGKALQNKFYPTCMKSPSQQFYFIVTNLINVLRTQDKNVCFYKSDIRALLLTLIVAN